MRNRTSLTKSLHTVSAVVNLACYLLDEAETDRRGEPAAVIADALQILGQGGPWPADDETAAACVKQLTKRLAQKEA